MNKKVIYIFGNSLLPLDNMPIKILPKLQKIFPEINFIIQDPNENLKPIAGKLMIIDTVIGIKKVSVIKNINKLQLSPVCSLHDFDLGYNLRLLHKIGNLRQIIIFGLPQNLDEKEALNQLKKIIIINL